jgi:hypothetical protein
MPRISAILSFLGSAFIIYDVLLKKRNRTAQHQLLVCLSAIDCMSSVAWALSSVPLPMYDDEGFPSGYPGAKGSPATCTAQGFFIQLGTASPFYNLAVAVYYSAIINYEWTEERIAKYRLWLIGIPVLCGLILACAGIPFYGPNAVMCYVLEHEVWFLVVPLSVVIVFATLMMTRIFLKVFRQERRVRKYSMSSQRMSRRVFWQGFWYLACFYVSWPVVIAWIFLDDSFLFSDKHFHFMCCALVMAPLQGFLNFLSYIRVRLLKSLPGFLGSRKSRTSRTATTASVEHSEPISVGEGSGNVEQYWNEGSPVDDQKRETAIPVSKDVSTPESHSPATDQVDSTVPAYY